MSETVDSSRYSANKDEKAIASEQRFQGQCFLITQMVKGDRRFMNSRTKGGQKYKYFTCLSSADGGATNVVSELTSIGKAQALFDMTSAELAHLVPQIRLFKVFEEPGKRNPLEREFKFNEGSFFKSENTDAGMMLSSVGGRGEDVGIESVSFELLATQPAEITNNITCQVKLFFKNLASLEKPLGQVIDGIPSVKPSDLILRPRTGNTSNEYQPEYYRVKLVVGWAIPPGVDMRPELLDAIKRQTKILNLTLKGHEFDFQMDGTTTLTIDYQAWVEGALSSQNTDLFQPSEEDRILLEGLRDELENEKDAAAQDSNFGQAGTQGASTSGGGTNAAAAPAPPNTSAPPKAPAANSEGEGETRIDQIESEIKEIEERTAAERYKELINLMTRAGGPAKMYYVDVDPNVVGSAGSDQQTKRSVMALERCKSASGSPRYGAGGGEPSSPTVMQTIRSAVTGQNPNQATEVGNAVSSAYDGNKLEVDLDGVQKAIDGLAQGTAGMIRIQYMFFGDLLEVALHMLEKHHRFKLSPASRITLLLGPCFISNPCDPGRYVAMNIADVPVSFSLFMDWFKTNILDQKIKTYLLRNFINDLLSKLFGPALGSECFSGVRQTFRVHADVLNLRGLGDSGTNAPIKKGQILNTNQVKEIVGRIDYSGGVNKKTHDYLLLYGYGMSPSHLKGNRFSDQLLGIYHFDLGRDVGILKSISFSKNDAPYLGEAKVTGKGNIAADLGGGSIYNADMDLVGNGLFVPGQYCYVNPRSLGLGLSNNPDSIANRIRLGGYYLVTKVSSDLAGGEFTTKISGIWESGGKVTPEPTTEAEPGSSNNEPADWMGGGFFGEEAKAWTTTGDGDENVERGGGDGDW